MTGRAPALLVVAAVAVAAVAIGAASASSGPPLMPVPAAMGKLCASAAERMTALHVRWRVVCPTEVPRTFSASFSLGGADLSLGLRRGYLIDCLGFSPTSHMHWLVAGGDPKELAGLLHPRNAVGAPVAHVSAGRSVGLGARQARLYLVAAGSQSLYADHVVVAWIWHGEAFQVSVHRWPNTRVATAQAIAVARSIARRE